MDQDFKIGDIVEIVTPDEYRQRGGRCSDDCAIAQYAGSVCRVTDVSTKYSDHRAYLAPISIVNNPISADGDNLLIEDYCWHQIALRMADGANPNIDEHEFDQVFE